MTNDNTKVLKLCAVYKSLRKSDTYLYVPGREAFADVPDALMASFGKPVFCMMLALQKERTLAQVDINKLRTALSSKGYYLQLPPPPENMLKAHLQNQQK